MSNHSSNTLSKDARIFIAGHRGMVGSAIWRLLQERGFSHLLGLSSKELDLRDPVATDSYFAEVKPQYVFLAAAKVGGILANNTRPVDFVNDNLLIQTNVFSSAHRHNVRKLLFLGSSCIYPKHSPQPITEDYLLSGHLEPTNEAYAIAKIAGVIQARSYRRQHGADFICAMPTNLYGPGDNFDLQNSHVLPALIRKIHEAHERGSTSVEVWGSGNPKREFLHVDDLAKASVFLMERYSGDVHVNVGTGEDISIRELASLVVQVVGYTGTLVFDPTKPDGTPRKLLDVSRIRSLGWQHTINLEHGIRSVYDWYVSNRTGDIRT